MPQKQKKYLFPYCEKSLICLPINDPSSGKYYSHSSTAVTPSSPSWNLEGLFQLKRRPSRAFSSTHLLLLELQRIKDTVRYVALGAEVKNNTIDVHLDGVFVENPLIFVILNIGRGGGPP